MRSCAFDSERRFQCVLVLATVLGGCWESSSDHVQSRECVACHLDDYEATTMPVHEGSFPTTCGECHTTDAWIPAVGGAHPESTFPIAEGPHTDIECASCHDSTRGTFAENTICVGCHTGEHERGDMQTLHDEHVVENYPSGASEPNFCVDCHPDGRVDDVTVHPEDVFSIESVHADIVCNQCHDLDLGSNGPENTDCVGCHTGEHAREANDTLHVMRSVFGYPEGDAPGNFCLVCHPDGTADAISHEEANFPITDGAHAGILCTDCHDTTLGANGPENVRCVSCHTDDHQRATMDALHTMRAVAGYPTGPAEDAFCLVCHPDGTADAAPHPEATFPIAMGSNHEDVICSDCHQAALGANGAGNTDCINCHTGEHLRAEIDPTHAGVSGYPSGAAPVNFCLDCHPDGTADSAAHPQDRFSITGKHDYECNECHDPALGSSIAGMNADCVGCHTGEHTRSRMDNKHREERDYPTGAAPPNFCLDCHPDGRN